MLVLARKIGQTIVIGNEIYLTVLGNQGHQIKLGFDAPKDVTIHRHEIFRKVQEENRQKFLVV